MSRVLGPILGFRQCRDDVWSVSVLVVTRGAAGALTWDIDGRSQGCAPVTIATGAGGHTVSRYLLDIAQQPDAQRVDYRVEGASANFIVPARRQSPQMAYASCNGFSSNKLMKGIDDKNAMWRRMRECHETRGGYHLLLLGGDQVYSDGMWETLPLLREWNELPLAAGNRRAFTAAMARQVDRFFFDLYLQRWAQPEVAAMLASVPCIAMWDDHDILDGWGSYPPARQECPVFRGIFEIAARAFRTFQHQLADGETHPCALSAHGLSLGVLAGAVGILALDMRSERSLSQVLGRAHWDDVYAWLDQAGAVDHMIVLSSIPVVYPGFDTLERLLSAVPGQQELEDDLRDHWSSRSHKGERLRLIHRLLDLAEAQRARPTLVSGDVHVAAVGVIEADRFGSGGERAVISQLISSGVVHPAPPRPVVFALRHLFDGVDELEPGVRARMTEFPGNASNFVGKRNFLSLEPDRETARRRLWANWFVEGEREPLVKVLHPMPPMRAEALTLEARWQQVVQAQAVPA